MGQLFWLSALTRCLSCDQSRCTHSSQSPSGPTEPTSLPSSERDVLLPALRSTGAGALVTWLFSCGPAVKHPGAPDAGNLHVRCDEGGGRVANAARSSSKIGRASCR